MNKMAIFKATYTKTKAGAKASLRYFEHRPGSDGRRMVRTLFNGDGALIRAEAYRMIDAAKEGSLFFRFVLSPDPKLEDTRQDLLLREVTERTMADLEARLKKTVSWVATIHADHTQYRHVHVLAVIPGKLKVPDLTALRTSATEASLLQRQQLDLAYAYQQGLTQEGREEGEAGWSLSY